MRIIIADDQDIARNMYTMMLSDYDCEVVEASSGKDAIDEAKKQKPDLIILDNFMPVMTGQDAVKNLRTDPALKDIPILFITAKDFDNSLREITKTDVQGFLAKPFTVDALVKAVESAMRKPLPSKAK